MKKPNTLQDLDIYKHNAKRTAFRAERDSQVSKYGRKSYVSKLINLFSVDKTGTSSYWLEVGE